jgi:lysophospholipase L1-like esterase
MSDSTGAGANGVGPFESWPWLTANYLGMDCINLSIGGSGYIASPSYQSRVQDVIDCDPDYLFVAGGQNDKTGNTTQAILDAFTLFCDSVTAALPNCKIIVGGVHMTTQNADATGAPLEAALKLESLVRKLPFVSQRDPRDVLSALPVWSNATAYKVGDMIQQNDLPFVCTVAHTSSGSFNAANFRCSSLFSGTGRVGSTANNGNFDVCMSSDGVHFTLTGMQIQGISYAQQIQKLID